MDFLGFDGLFPSVVSPECIAQKNTGQVGDKSGRRHPTRRQVESATSNSATTSVNSATTSVKSATFANRIGDNFGHIGDNFD